MEDAEKDVQFSADVKVHPLNASTGLTRKAMEEFQKASVFGDLSFLDPGARKHMELFIGMLVDGCRLTVQNKEFMRWLSNQKFDLAFSHMYHTCPIGLIHAAKIPTWIWLNSFCFTVTVQNKEFMRWLSDQKFDLAFSHMYHTCPIGLIHAAKIPTWIWLNSGQLMDNVAHLIGVPTLPSYVPPLMMDSGDEMDFIRRTKSFIGHTLLNLLWPWMVPNKETQIFREHWDSNFPDIMDLAKNCPLVMVNSNELYELPRPTLAKVVNIGGVGVEFKDAKPLQGEFKKIAESGKGMIVMSFGSVAHAELMPEHWKTALLNAFAEFPDYEFVVKYAHDDLK
ncbi:unnamed protein product, partial [Strongylus vulgaris]